MTPDRDMLLLSWCKEIQWIKIYIRSGNSAESCNIHVCGQEDKIHLKGDRLRYRSQQAACGFMYIGGGARHRYPLLEGCVNMLDGSAGELLVLLRCT